MKKFIFVIIAILFFCLNLNAQKTLFVEMGVNHSNAKFNSDLLPTSPFRGFYLGVIPKFKINEKFKFNSEVQFSREGFAFKLSQATTGHKFYYLRIIPQLEWQPLSYFSLNAGGNFGLNTIEKIALLYPNTGFTEFVTIDSRTIKYADLGIMIGAKIYIKRFYFAVKYNHGVMNINNVTLRSDPFTPIENIYQRNINIQIGLGFKLI